MAQRLTDLPCKFKKLNLVPSTHLQGDNATWRQCQCWGGGDRRSPGAHHPVRQITSPSSVLGLISKREEEQLRRTSTSTSGLHVLDTCMCTCPHTGTCTYMNTYKCIRVYHARLPACSQAMDCSGDEEGPARQRWSSGKMSSDCQAPASSPVCSVYKPGLPKC